MVLFNSEAFYMFRESYLFWRRVIQLVKRNQPSSIFLFESKIKSGRSTHPSSHSFYFSVCVAIVSSHHIDQRNDISYLTNDLCTIVAPEGRVRKNPESSNSSKLTSLS